VVLACSDSRVSPELLFDQGIGDLFSIRVAGNVANEDEAASVEYAADHLGVPVCVVLGHTGCGAVAAVTHGERLPHRFDHLLGPVRETVDKLHASRPSLRGPALDAEAVRANVWRATADLLHDEAIRERVRKRKLVVLGAVYDTQTGKVHWLGHHPEEKRLVAAPAPQTSGGGRPH
jgi:carbonic anhydrase